MGTFPYAKPTGQRSVGIPEELERHFLITPGQSIEIDIATFFYFSEFPN